MSERHRRRAVRGLCAVTMGGTEAKVSERQAPYRLVGLVNGCWKAIFVSETALPVHSSPSIHHYHHLARSRILRPGCPVNHA